MRNILPAVLVLTLWAAPSQADAKSERGFLSSSPERSDGGDELRAAVGTIRTTSSSEKDPLPSFRQGEFLFYIDAQIRNVYNGTAHEKWLRPFARMDLEALVSLDFIRPYRVWKNEYRVDTDLIGYRYRLDPGRFSPGVKPGATGTAGEPVVAPFAAVPGAPGTTSRPGVEHGVGIFAGGDYYRPRLASNAVGWNDPINDRFPHVQYFTWRTAGAKTFHEEPVGPFGLRASLGGYHVLSQSSSLPMHDKQDACEEVDKKPRNKISPVFMGKCNTKQNYYYSQGFLAEAEAGLRHPRYGEVVIRDLFAAFRPLLREAPVRDTVHRPRAILRWFATPHVDLETGVEFWTLWGRLNEERETRRWGSLWLAAAYRL